MTVMKIARPSDQSGRVEVFLQGDYVKVVQVVSAATGSRDRAQDAVDEALVRLLLHLRRGREVESVTAWVTTVALNYSMSRWRKLRFESASSRDHPDLGAENETDVPVLVRGALAQLPFRQRESAVLFYLCDMSVDEIAKALSLRPGTVKSHLSRARAALAVSLRPVFNETRGSTHDSE
jgi:RNA polymerase sigma-70 factor, ECF subfamily